MPTSSRKKSAPRPADNSFSLISNEKLLALYAALLKCRMMHESLSVLREQAQRASGRSLASEPSAQEAAIVGAAIDLLPGDMVAISGEGTLPSLVLGAALDKCFARPQAAAVRGRPAAFAATVPATTVPATVLAAARAHRSKQDKSIAVAFCGATAASQSWRRVLRAAGAERLPIIFVAHASADAEERGAQDCGFPAVTPAISVDAHDVVAIYRVASEAIAHARRGNGPTSIECAPWRTPGEQNHSLSESGDAIQKMESYLAAKRIFPDRCKREVTEAFHQQLRAARQRADLKPGARIT